MAPAYSNVASATTPLAPPAAPTGLSATAVSVSRIDLAWSDAADNEAGFEIERSPDGATWSLLATVGANVLAYRDDGLDDDTAYHYRVRAGNDAGWLRRTRTWRARRRPHWC